MGPIWHGGREKERDLLKSCYEKSFILAKEHSLRSIAFPAISTGVYGYPIEEATRIAIQAGKNFEKDFDEIRYICFSKRDLDVYNHVFDELR